MIHTGPINQFQSEIALKPTDIKDPEYFHKVVDCQYACPAHAGAGIHPPDRRGQIYRGVHDQLGFERVSRYSGPNLRPSVRTGVPSRTHRRRTGRDLPPETCRGGQSRTKSNTVDAARSVQAERQKGRADRCRAGVADGRARSRTARLRDPSFRRTVQGRRLYAQPDPGVSPARNACSTKRSITSSTSAFTRISRHYVSSLKEVLEQDYDAVFVGTGAPRGRELKISRTRRRRGEYPHRHQLARQRRVRAHEQDRQDRDRPRRRQHRDGLLPHGASSRRRRRKGHRPLAVRDDEGVARGKKKTRSTKTSRSSTTTCRSHS